MARKKSPKIVKITVRPFILAALIILELAGIAIALYLTYIHYKAGGAFCDINTTFSCSEVATSEYSEIFGIPISWLGVLTYIALFVLTIMGWKPEKGRIFSRAPLYMLVISIWCVVYSVILAAISTFVLKAYCINCIALYFVNLGLLLGSWAWSGAVEEGRWAPLLEDLKDGIGNIRVWVAVSLGVLLLVASWAFFVFVLPSSSKATFRDMNLSYFPRRGPANAPVKIVEFSDLKCPWCKKTHEILEQARTSYGDKFAVYFVHFPLDQNCNEKMTRTAHKGACEGAYATHCAQVEGKFWEYTSKLFAHQDDNWDENALTGYAKEIGLNPDKFRSCLSDPNTKAYVAENARKGNKISINHTPTLFFNGIEASNFAAKGLPGFIEELQQALSGTLKPPEEPKQQ